MTYDDKSFNVYDNGTGIYNIESYFILYSSQSVNQYSTSICDVFDTTYFTPHQEYTFEVTISVSVNISNYNEDTDREYEVQTVQQSVSLNMTANNIPSGGDCTVSPRFNGTALFDTFNFTCNGWNDTETKKSDLIYNFVYKNLLFLKDNYDNTQWVITALANGNNTITAVILDDLSLATCVDITVEASIQTISQLQLQSNLSLGNVTSWLLSTCKNITNIGIVNESLSTSTISLYAHVVYEITADYYQKHIPTTTTTTPNTTNINSTDSTVSGSHTLYLSSILIMADFQSDMIDLYISAVSGSNSIDTYQECDVILTTLQILTQPVVDTTLIPALTSTGVTLYNASVIGNILGLIDNILDVMIDNILSHNSSIGSLESDTAETILSMYTFVS